MVNVSARFCIELKVVRYQELLDLLSFVRDAKVLSEWQTRTGMFESRIFKKRPLKELRQEYPEELPLLRKFLKTKWLKVFKAWTDALPYTQGLVFNLADLDVTTRKNKKERFVVFRSESDFTDFEALCGLMYEFFRATESDLVFEGTYSITTYPLRPNGSTGGFFYASRKGWDTRDAAFFLHATKRDLRLGEGSL